MSTKKTFMKKLLDVRMALQLPKDELNADDGFFYRNAEKMLGKIKPELAKEGLTMWFSDDVTAAGNRNYVKTTLTVADTESGETLSVTAAAMEDGARSMPSAPMATGSASSYARKYALQGMFALDDGKMDPDSFGTRGYDAANAAPPAPAPEYAAPAAPAPEYAAPAAPAVGYAAPAAPAPEYAAPAAPAIGYEAPAAPAIGYVTQPAAAPEYEAPTAPAVGYEAPVAGQAPAEPTATNQADAPAAPAAEEAEAAAPTPAAPPVQAEPAAADAIPAPPQAPWESQAPAAPAWDGYGQGGYDAAPSYGFDTVIGSAPQMPDFAAEDGNDAPMFPWQTGQDDAAAYGGAGFDVPQYGGAYAPPEISAPVAPAPVAPAVVGEAKRRLVPLGVSFEHEFGRAKILTDAGIVYYKASDEGTTQGPWSADVANLDDVDLDALYEDAKSNTGGVPLSEYAGMVIA